MGGQRKCIPETMTAFALSQSLSLTRNRVSARCRQRKFVPLSLATSSQAAQVQTETTAEPCGSDVNYTALEHCRSLAVQDKIKQARKAFTKLLKEDGESSEVLRSFAHMVRKTYLT